MPSGNKTRKRFPMTASNIECFHLIMSFALSPTLAASNNNPILFNAKVSGFGKKGKIQFNIVKNIQFKEDSTKELKISGFMIPSSSKIIFEKILFDKKIFTVKKIREYENKFKSEVINNSLNNIFNEKKINNFFKKNFVN